MKTMWKVIIIVHGMVSSQHLPKQIVTIKDLTNNSVLARIQDVHLLSTFRSITTCLVCSIPFRA